MHRLLDLVFGEFATGVGVSFLTAAGLTLPADEYKAFRAAKVCFVFAAVWLWGKALMWSLFTHENPYIRTITIFLVFGMVGVLLMEALFLTDRRKASLSESSTSGRNEIAPNKQLSSGPNSPNIIGNNNTVNIGVAPPAKNPPKKGEKASDIAEGAFLGGGFREGKADTDLIGVRVGGAYAANPRGWLKNGTPLIPLVIGPEKYTPIKIGMDKNGKLLFTCALIGGDESNPFQVQITNNVFNVVSGFVQKNYNDAALEVADDNGVPLFQVIQEGPNQLRINGVFVLGSSSATGKIIRLWAWGKNQATDSERPKDFVLKPIFKYPAWKYLGKYAD
jgi:hypothetical protein